jgi:type II secretory pathway predicted ATPase ExeA
MADSEHNHPQHEGSLNRITTVLEKLVDVQARMNAMQERQQTQIAALVEAQQQTTLKLNEATDKLNALIDLMDGHLGEHRDGKS